MTGSTHQYNLNSLVPPNKSWDKAIVFIYRMLKTGKYEKTENTKRWGHWIHFVGRREHCCAYHSFLQHPEGSSLPSGEILDPVMLPALCALDRLSCHLQKEAPFQSVNLMWSKLRWVLWLKPVTPLVCWPQCLQKIKSQQCPLQWHLISHCYHPIYIYKCRKIQ